MIQIRVYEALGDAEYAQTFYKVLFPFGRNNNFIEHIFIADVFQAFEGVVYGEVGVLGVHTEIVLRGAAGQDLVFQFRVMVIVFERRQQHFLGGVCVDGVDAVAEAFFFIQKSRGQYPDAGVDISGLAISLRSKKYGDQRRLRPVQHTRGQTVVLHQGDPSGVVVFLGGILQNLSGSDIEIIGDIAFGIQSLLASLDGRNQCQICVFLSAVPELETVLLIQTADELQEFVDGAYFLC